MLLLLTTMLRAIALHRRQAVSAGLVAGTFFSKGCVDENYGTTGADAGSAHVEEFASAPEPDITPMIHPVVTKLPDASKERFAARPAENRKNSVEALRARNARNIELAESDREFTEPARELIEPPQELTEPALAERPLLADESDAGARAEASELQREPMMQDAYAAFGVEKLY